MHELGHNLGLTHGGSLDEDAINHKPNYPSIMNYFWQSTGVPKYDHLGLLDYSEGTLDPIDEGIVNEHAGLSPDNVASDIGTSWYCGVSKQGPDPSVFDIDFNCDHHISSSSASIDVNSDGQKTVMHDHDDWSSLTYDGGGALGGAGDAAAATAAAPVEEPDSTQLQRDSRDLQTVALTGPGVLSIQSKTSAPLTLDLVNHHDVARTYTLTTTSAGVSLSGLPAQVALAPQEHRTLTVTLIAGTTNANAFFEVDADSGDITDADSAITEVAVVDQDVPDQPGKPKPPAAQAAPPLGGVTTIADTRRALRVVIDGKSAGTLAGHGIGRVSRLAPGAHTVRVIEVLKTKSKKGKRVKALVASVRIKLSSKQLQALVVSGSKSKLKVKVVKVGAGKRALLSLLSGTRSVRLGSAKAKVKRVRHAVVVNLGKATTVRVGKRRVDAAVGAQLTILVQKGRKINAVTRSAG
jgi:hypothetical protein